MFHVLHNSNNAVFVVSFTHNVIIYSTAADIEVLAALCHRLKNNRY